MVKVKVLLSTISTDHGEEVLSLDASTVTQLFGHLKERYPRSTELQMPGAVAVLINGKTVVDFTEKLRDDDEVLILPIVLGG